jgi:predicted dehydrogenase
MKKVRFGVLSTAKIAREKVIPAMQKSSFCEVKAIASRNEKRAREVADQFSVPNSHSTYEELLADPQIDAIYNPLPNHLHVQWSIKALMAGKHVLCEKPVGLDAEDARRLLDASRQFPDLKVMEAFMYLHHPRWKRAAELAHSGKLGEIKAVHSFFSYYNDDPQNYRNSAEMGGGGLMDIGCYSVSVARLIFGRKPDFVTGFMELDPDFKVDRLTSGLMAFGTGTSVFTCATQCHKDQYVKIYGTNGKLEIDWPFNPDFTKKTVLKGEIGNDEFMEEFSPCDHFRLQGDAFARSVLDNTPVPIPLEDSIENMEVIDWIRNNQAR